MPERWDFWGSSAKDVKKAFKNTQCRWTHNSRWHSQHRHIQHLHDCNRFQLSTCSRLDHTLCGRTTSKPEFTWISRRLFGNSPTLQHSIRFQPEIPVEVSCVVSLDYENCHVGLSWGFRNSKLFSSLAYLNWEINDFRWRILIIVLTLRSVGIFQFQRILSLVSVMMTRDSGYPMLLGPGRKAIILSRLRNWRREIHRSILQSRFCGR